MLVDKYRDYFTAVRDYHLTPPSKRKNALFGGLRLASEHHKDPVTRELLRKFFILEERKYMRESG